METNQNLVQEQPAQTIVHETTVTTQPEPQPVPNSEPTESASQQQPDQPAELLYDPAEAAQIVHNLTDGYFAPEYILLFGKLVGGTRHSDATAYDLWSCAKHPNTIGCGQNASCGTECRIASGRLPTSISISCR